jgi:tetratricopeptide (TPR) repeat protein
MKCLEKDRARRYETANGLAMDIQRHLNNEPVLARPPSTAYRLQKLVRRHKLAVAAAAAVLVALMVAAGAGAVAWRTMLAQRALLNVQRRAAMEKAFMTVETGDFEEANRAIADAELGGASPAEIHLLRGNLAFIRGNLAAARRELEQAIKLAPKSVAAHFLLHGVLSRTGDPEARRVFNVVERLKPVSAEDFLFLGSLVSAFDPERAVRFLDEAVRLWPCAFTRMVRAEARARRATDTGALTDAQLALADLNFVKEMVPDRGAVLLTELKASEAAIIAHLEAGQTNRAQAFLARADAAAKALERYPKYGLAVLERARYFDEIRGDEAAALAELSRASATLDSRPIDHHYAMLLFRRGESAKATEVIERRIRSGRSFEDGGLILLALPDGPNRAMEEHRRIMTGHPPIAVALATLAVPLALGREAEAVEGARQTRDRLRGQPSLLTAAQNGYYLQLLDFIENRLSEEKLLEAAGASRINRAEAHFWAGLKRLGQGDRTAARAHFQRGAAFTAIPTPWSRVFLARMDADPTWPPWLPPGKPQRSGAGATDAEPEPTP